jgi:hypothetical protein
LREHSSLGKFPFYFIKIYSLIIFLCLIYEIFIRIPQIKYRIIFSFSIKIAFAKFSRPKCGKFDLLLTQGGIFLCLTFVDKFSLILSRSRFSSRSSLAHKFSHNFCFIFAGVSFSSENEGKRCRVIGLKLQQIYVMTFLSPPPN